MKRIISILIIFISFMFFASCSYCKEISIIRTANYGIRYVIPIKVVIDNTPRNI